MNQTEINYFTELNDSIGLDESVEGRYSVKQRRTAMLVATGLASHLQLQDSDGQDSISHAANA